MSELTDSIRSRVEFDDQEAIVLRLKEGDETAFSEAFHLYKDLVYGLCMNILSDKSEAMDVTQEVFIAVYRKIRQFRGECSLKTWIYRIAVNQAANRNRWWRRRFRNRTISLDLAGNRVGQARASANEAEPDQRILASEIRQAIEKGLAELPFDQRAAVILRDVDGLSYKEISEVMGVRIGTIKSRIARGREKLRDVLEPYHNGGIR